MLTQHKVGEYPALVRRHILCSRGHEPRLCMAWHVMAHLKVAEYLSMKVPAWIGVTKTTGPMHETHRHLCPANQKHCSRLVNKLSIYSTHHGTYPYCVFVLCTFFGLGYPVKAALYASHSYNRGEASSSVSFKHSDLARLVCRNPVICAIRIKDGVI